ncbi:hypothetical protein Phpb_01927 [Photorhabdus namnaonensis]|uniref:Secreted protein n=1 Tax=Photorhabdus namnaonensis TaxID=1851568 RepID=A0A1B8YIP7_9GAMM|nr:hypothetical protein Phpb_01927 [Photorhabdus namnaonensis]
MINRPQYQLLWAFLTLTFFSAFSTPTHACILYPHFPICAAKCVIFSSHTATCIIGSHASDHLTPDYPPSIVSEKSS